MTQNFREGTPWDLIIKFLFWTGCRHGECAGLHWTDVTADCSKIYFRFTYPHRYNPGKARKGLKTAGKGADFRSFNCGSKLQELLLDHRPKGDFNRDSPVFCNRNGDYINFTIFGNIWRGTNRTDSKGNIQKRGIIPQLMQEGKIKYYLSPYATRATFINLMLDNTDYTAREVATITGHSVATLEAYYRDKKSRREVVPIEI